MESVASPHAWLVEARHHPQVDKQRPKVGGTLPDENVEPLPALTRYPAERDALARIEACEHHGGGARRDEPLKDDVDRVRERWNVTIHPNQVIATGSNADEGGAHLLDPRELLVHHSSELPPAHGQIRIQQTRVFKSQSSGDQIRPAAVGAVRPRVVETLGEAVADGDETLEHSRSPDFFHVRALFRNGVGEITVHP